VLLLSVVCSQIIYPHSHYAERTWR
jgi:hypothetical protein